MDPNTQRAEAERWLGIAVKLLTTRDFLGSKTFAIRAREADPHNAVSDQVLAVVDTVLAGEKRLNTATQQPDWYTVLQLPRLVRDPELIATHYRRLVLLLNPERNRLPFADYALQLVMDAWTVLSDPTKKWLFDNELAMSLQSQPHRSDRVEPFRVDPGRVDPDVVAASSAAPLQLNTFQFFQPQSQPQQQQNSTLPMWQQHQTQREFMSPPPTPPMPATSGPPAQPLLPQWQMRDRTPSKGVERCKDSANGTSSTSSAPPPQQPPPSTQVPVATARPPPPPPPVAPTPSPKRARATGTNNVVDDGNASNVDNANSDPNVASAPAPAPAGVDDVDGEEEEIESFWTACPYCFYIYEYQKMYEDCTLRCQNCRRGYHAAQIPNPPPISRSGGGKGKGKESSFCCWGFFPLGFSMAAWKKHSESQKAKGSSNWVPFSPMFTCPTENGDGNFHLFAHNGDTFVGQKNVGRDSRFAGGENVRTKGRPARPKNVEEQGGQVNNSAPRVYVNDEAYMELSDSSDSDSSDQDWRNPTKNKKKVMKRSSGRKRGRPRRVDEADQVNENATRGGGVFIGGEDLEDGSESQQVVVGLAAGARTDTSKNAVASVSRKQTRRTVKDMGRLDLNVELNNDGEEHAPAVSTVNGEEDGIETIEFFEGLDEFLSTLPILNVGGDEKAKPS